MKTNRILALLAAIGLALVVPYQVYAWLVKNPAATQLDPSPALIHLYKFGAAVAGHHLQFLGMVLLAVAIICWLLNRSFSKNIDHLRARQFDRVRLSNRK